MAELVEDTVAAVAHLKAERDTWRAVADKYKAAFEDQVARFEELRDICIATQAELENARTLNRSRPGPSVSNLDRDDNSSADAWAGLAVTVDTTPLLGPDSDEVCRYSASMLGSCFRRVEQLALDRDYGTALKEVDSLLQSPLGPESRVEGLLLKSSLMRKSEWLYDALAACSEGAELCNRFENLRSYIPRLRYQQGLCYYQLNMLQQARDAFDQVSAVDDSLNANAFALRDSCEGRLQARHRSGFEASRSATDGLLSASEHRFDPKRKRTSFLRSKRLSLPKRRLESRPKSAVLH